MGDRLRYIKSSNGIRWDAPPAMSGANEYMELLVKETVTLHEVLSRYPVVEVCRNSNPNALTTDDVLFAVRDDASLRRHQSQAFGRVH